MKSVVNNISLALSAVALLSAPALAQTPCRMAPAAVQIAAGPLDQSLTALAKQTGCPVHYDRKQVQAFRAPVLQGRLTASDALVRLVQGSGLEAHSLPTGLSVNQADQEKFGLRAATLQAQLGQAVKSQQLTQTVANAMYQELGEVRTSVTELAKKQGFVSAAEKASYQRSFARAEKLLTSRKQS